MCICAGQADGPGRQLKQSGVDPDVLGQIIQVSCSNAAYDAWSAAASASFEGNSRCFIRFNLAHTGARTPSADHAQALRRQAHTCSLRRSA